MPPPPPPPSSPDGVGWSLVPLLTVGLGSPISFLYAGVRRKSTGLCVSGAAYGGLLIGSFGSLAAPEPGLHVLGVLLLMLVWITSTVHGFVARDRVYPSMSMRQRMNQQSIQFARRRRGLREEARKLVADDPALGHELRIGRPDLPRAFDDGGLIDVNHAPAATLTLLPGVTDELATHIVRLRTDIGTFISVEELAVQANLPPDIIPAISDYTIFLA
jgi:Helix-hairpin-helix motif